VANSFHCSSQAKETGIREERDLRNAERVSSGHLFRVTLNSDSSTRRDSFEK